MLNPLELDYTQTLPIYNEYDLDRMIVPFLCDTLDSNNIPTYHHAMLITTINLYIVNNP